MAGWVGRSAGQISAAVRGGEVTPAQVVREHLAQIDRLEPQVGAFVRVLADRAVTEAEALSGRGDLAALPLAGVPIAIKDNIAVAGEPTRHGSAATDDTPAARDHDVVRRLREAGAVVVGITRMPELGVWATSDDADGVARNPWNLELTAGGSSGGSAAAVAAAMVPAAHGNDGLGSIRIPASACGLVGIKPGAGVVPSDVGVSSWRGMSENGPLTTTVADAALLLSVMAGRPGLARIDTPASLTVAASTRVPLAGVRLDPEVLRAVIAAAAALRTAGHRILHQDPPYSQATANAIVAWYTAATADEVATCEALRLQPRQRRHAQIGRTLERLGRVREQDRDRWKEQAAGFFDTHDLLLTPVTTGTPPAAGPWRERSWAANMSANARWAPFPGIWNFAGFPAMTVPAAVHTSGVPIGVQLVAPPGGEALLLAVAAQMESLVPWRRHAPLAGRSEA
jgi:amidase